LDRGQSEGPERDAPARGGVRLVVLDGQAVADNAGLGGLWRSRRGHLLVYTVEHTTPDNRTWKIDISGRNDLDEVLETLQQYEREEQEKRNTET
jgi:hypothetical protein